MIFVKKIRFVVFSYSLVIAVMLLQTPVKSIGTISALLTMGLTFFAYLNTHNGLNKNQMRAKNLLILFSIYMLFQTALSPYSEINNSLKFIAQALLTCVLMQVSLENKEYRFMVYSYELFISIWSIFIILSCLLLSPTRNIHGTIELFGANIDPNFIGIPLVTASILLLNDILNISNKRFYVCFIIGYILNVIAIIETSSRGNLLSFALGNGLILLYYIFNKKKSSKKILVLFVISIILFYGLQYLSNVFEENLTRMTEINSESGQRLSLWKYSMDLWLSSPSSFIFGNGYNAVVALEATGHCSHNTYMQLLSETGIVGFYLFVAFLFHMIKKCYYSDKVITICFVVMLFQIMFLNALDNRCVWGLLGWIAMIPKQQNNKVIYK